MYSRLIGKRWFKNSNVGNAAKLRRAALSGRKNFSDF
jgi:hypothetical protein